MTHIAVAKVETRGAPYALDIRTGTHVVVADEPEARGGTDAGPAPYELLLCALGACTAMTLRIYAEKKGWDLGKVWVELRLGKDQDTDRIEREVRIEKHITEEQRARLLEIAAKTPVTKTISHGAVISTTIK